MLRIQGGLIAGVAGYFAVSIQEWITDIVEERKKNWIELEGRSARQSVCLLEKNRLRCIFLVDQLLVLRCCATKNLKKWGATLIKEARDRTVD